MPSSSRARPGARRASAGCGLCAVPQLHRPPRRGLLRTLRQLRADRPARASRPAFRLSREPAGQEVGRGGAQRRIPSALAEPLRRDGRIFRSPAVVRPPRSGPHAAGHDLRTRGRRGDPQTLVQELRIRLQERDPVAAGNHERRGRQQTAENPGGALGQNPFPAGLRTTRAAARNDPLPHAGGGRSSFGRADPRRGSPPGAGSPIPEKPGRWPA